MDIDNLVGELRKGNSSSLGSGREGRAESAAEIYSFLTQNKPFKKLIESDPVFSRLKVEMIEGMISDFESIGSGPPTLFKEHCPAISAFFFPDILFFLIIAYEKKDAEDSTYLSLLQDVVLYFATGKIIFEPRFDPRL